MLYRKCCVYIYKVELILRRYGDKKCHSHCCLSANDVVLPPQMEIASSPTSNLTSNVSSTAGGNVLSREQLNQSIANIVEFFQTGNTDKFNISLDLKEVNVRFISYCCKINTYNFNYQVSSCLKE